MVRSGVVLVKYFPADGKHARTGAFYHIEHHLKTLRTAIIGIRNLGRLLRAALVLRQKRAEQSQTGPGASGEVLQFPQVVAVHGHDEVEIFRVFGSDLARDGSQCVATVCRSLAHAGIGGFAAMVVNGAGGVDMKILSSALLFDVMAEHAFSRGGSANISHADK